MKCKRILCSLLASMMLTCAVPVTAFAAEIADESVSNQAQTGAESETQSETEPKSEETVLTESVQADAETHTVQEETGTGTVQNGEGNVLSEIESEEESESSSDKEKEDKEDSNYSYGNVVNGGHAVSYEGVVYFSNMDDMGCLYAQDDSGVKKLTNYGVQFLNVTPKGEVFYTCIDAEAGQTQIGVYHTASGSNQIVFGIDMFKGIRNLLVQDDTCYFISDGVVYALHLDSGNQETMLGGKDQITEFLLYDGGYAYGRITENGPVIVVYSYETMQEKTVANGCSFDIADGYIYFSDGDADWALSSVKLDGSDKKVLVQEQVSNVIATDDQVYFKDTEATSSVQVYDVDSGAVANEGSGDCTDFVVLDTDEVFTTTAETADLSEFAVGEDGNALQVGRMSVVSEYKTWKQTDSRWGGKYMTSYGETLRQSGCLITSIAMLIVDANAIPKGYETTFSPGVFLDMLLNNGGLTSTGLLYWGAVSNIIPKFSNVGFGQSLSGMSRAAKIDAIKKHIDAGHVVIATVDYGNHYVAVDRSKIVTGSSGYVGIWDPAYSYTNLFGSNGWPLESVISIAAYSVSGGLGSSPSTTTPSTTEKLEVYKVNDDGINYRTSPSLSGAIGGSMKKGTSVNVVQGYAKTADGYTWYKIKVGSNYYYMASKFLTKYTAPSVTSVTLNSTASTLYVGGNTLTLKATCAPSDAANTAITWTSSDTTVATVSGSGVVTPKKAGTATITAKTANGKTAACKVTVKAETLAAYQTTDDVYYRTSPGTTGSIAGTLKKGTKVNVVTGFSQSANSYTWNKIKIGTSYYYVAKNYLSQISVSSVTLNSTAKTLYVNGATAQLTATVAPTNASDKRITWTSSDATVAAVSSTGVVTPKKVGTATITAKSVNGKTATCTVTVKAEVLVDYKTTDAVNYRSAPGLSGVVKGTLSKGTTVKVVPDYSKTADNYTWLKIKIGSAYYYAVSKYLQKVSTTPALTLSKTAASLTVGGATLKLTTSSTGTVTWSSSNSAVATVNSSGVITPVKAGTAKITAKASNGATATCTVTVTAAAETLLDYKTTDSVNYRSAPGLSGTLKGTLQKGTAVKVVSGYSKAADGYTWYKIKIGSSYYYAVSAYLQKATTATTAKLQMSSASATLYVRGLSQKLTATGGTGITWSSSNTAVATVSSTGVVAPVKAGTVTITAKASNGATGTCTVTVKPETLLDYKTTDVINYRSAPGLSGAVKGTLQKGAAVKVIAGYAKAADNYTWYQIKIGTGYYYVASKFLLRTTTTPTITISKTSASLYEKGPTLKLTTSYTGTVTWSSSNTAVATVSSTGVVTPVKAGTATITAKAANGATATCKITVTAEALASYKLIEDGVNYRISPTTSSVVAGVLRKDAVVNVVKGYSTTANNLTWYKIKMGTNYYYIAAKYLKLV